MFKIPTFRLKLQPSSGESDKNLHRERTYNKEKSNAKKEIERNVAIRKSGQFICLTLSHFQIVSPFSSCRYKFLGRVSMNKWSLLLEEDVRFSVFRFWCLLRYAVFPFKAFGFQFSAKIQAVFRIWYPMWFSVFPI